MPHIKNYLPNNQEELQQVLISTTMNVSPFKLGDCVKCLNDETSEPWVITAFTATANGEHAALLESETGHTFVLLRDIQFYYH